MLDVSLTHVSNFALRDVSLTFPASTHTAIVGPPASGATTLLRLIAGTLKADSGEIRFGTRVVKGLRASERPVLFATAEIDAPARWSVRHVLVAAVKRRTLDRIDRQHEYELAIEKWSLRAILDRRVRTLSDSERTSVNLARIELLRPGILLADRVLERLNPAASDEIIDKFYRTLRVSGATVLSAPAYRVELGVTDRVIVLSNGRIVQEGSTAHVYSRPADEAAARATGEINIVPVSIDGTSVESAMGSWDVATAPFQGSGVALVRPESLSVAEAGKESDVIVAVEEASFESGRWIVRAMLSGGLTLRIALPANASIHKGKLLALSYDPSRFVLIQREMEAPRRTVPVDVLPPMRNSR